MTTEEKRIGADKQHGAGLQGQIYKRRVKIGIRAGVDCFNVKAKARRAGLQVLEIRARQYRAGVDERVLHARDELCALQVACQGVDGVAIDAGVRSRRDRARSLI